MQRDRRRVAEHGAARGDRVRVAELGAQILREQALQGGHQVVHAVQHHPRHLDRGGMRLRAIPRGARSDAPSYRDAAAGEPERAVGKRGREPVRREGRRADHRRSCDGAPGGDPRHVPLDETGQVGQGEDRRRLAADERFPALADQVRAGAQLRQWARAGERRPGEGGLRVQ